MFSSPETPQAGLGVQSFRWGFYVGVVDEVSGHRTELNLQPLSLPWRSGVGPSSSDPLIMRMVFLMKLTVPLAGTMAH